MSKRIKQNMASGKSESNAWVNAKKSIMEDDKEIKK